MSIKVGRIDLGLGVNKEMFNKQLSGIAGGAERQVKSAFGGMGLKIGKTLGLAIGGTALVSFTKSALKLGSNLSEVQNVVDVTFKQMSSSVNTFAQNAMEQFGLSETLAKKYMGVYGAMSKSMGMTEKQAFGMAKSITGLSGDVASFYNLSADEAYTKLKSIWTGETETLKELGIIMTQTNLDNYALNNGFGKTTKTMTEQEKLMLRYQYVMSRLSAAQGDFTQTSNNWANQTRVLSLRFDALKATLGQGLINLFTPIVKMINTVLAKLQVLAEAFKRFTEMISGKKSESSGLGSVASDITDATAGLNGEVDGLGNEATKAAKKIQRSLAGFDELNVLTSPESGDTGGSSGAGSSGLDAGLLGGMTVDTPNIDIKTNVDASGFEKLREIIQPTIDAVQRLQAALEPLKSFVAQALYDFYNSFLVPIAQWTFGEGLPRFIDAITNGLASIDWQKINGALNTLWQALAPFAINVGEGLLWFWENVLAPLGAWTMSNVVPVFLDILAGAISILNNTIDALKPLGQWLWDNFLLPVAKWTGGVIVDVLESISGVLKGIGDWIKDHQKAVETFAIIVGSFAAAWNLVNMAIGIWNAVGAIATGVTTAFGAAVAFLTSPVTLTIAAIAALIAIVVLLIRNWDTVKEVASDCWEGIKNAWSAAGDWFKTSITEPVKNAFVSAWEGTKNAWSASKSFFSGVWGGIKGAFGNVSDWFKNTFAAAWSKVKTVFAVGGVIFDGIKEGISDTFKTVVNALIGGINKIISVPFRTINGMLNKIRSVNVLGISPFQGLWKENPLPVPQIPKLAKGGIVDTPTLAMIGEKGKEAVVPLEDTSFVSTLAGAIAREIAKVLGGPKKPDNNGTGDLVLRIGESEFARIAIDAINEAQRRAGTTLIIV